MFPQSYHWEFKNTTSGLSLSANGALSAIPVEREWRWVPRGALSPIPIEREWRWAPRGVLSTICRLYIHPQCENTIFHSSLLKNATQTIKPHFSTTGDHRKPPLLAIEPPHQEEHFNHSGILRILLKDSMEKIPQSFISKFLWGNLDF